MLKNRENQMKRVFENAAVRLTDVARNAYSKMKTETGNELASTDMYVVSESCHIQSFEIDCKVKIYKFVNGFKKEYVVMYFDLIKA